MSSAKFHAFIVVVVVDVDVDVDVVAVTVPLQLDDVVCHHLESEKVNILAPVQVPDSNSDSEGG